MTNNANANGNNTKSALGTLAASSNMWVQLATVGLVGISGFTSFFQGLQLSDEGKQNRDRAVKQISELYNRIDEFEKRQVLILSNQREITESNGQQIRNQTEMLENQEAVLKIMKENQLRVLQKTAPTQP